MEQDTFAIPATTNPAFPVVGSDGSIQTVDLALVVSEDRALLRIGGTLVAFDEAGEPSEIILPGALHAQAAIESMEVAMRHWNQPVRLASSPGQSLHGLEYDGVRSVLRGSGHPLSLPVHLQHEGGLILRDMLDRHADALRATDVIIFATTPEFATTSIVVSETVDPACMRLMALGRLRSKVLEQVSALDLDERCEVSSKPSLDPEDVLDLCDRHLANPPGLVIWEGDVDPLLTRRLTAHFAVALTDEDPETLSERRRWVKQKPFFYIPKD